MTWLTTSPTCDETDRLCEAVLEATDSDWLAAAADWLIAKPLAIVGIIVLGLVLRWIANKLIARLVNHAVEGVFPSTALRSRVPLRNAEQQRLVVLAAERRRQRAETLGSVLRSIASFVIFTIVVMMVLSEFGFDIGPLVASAGLVGVALGFGAQNLVKDFLSGLFMFFEDQCGVGDTVIIGETEGVVEALTLRITRVRGEDGTIWYLRNGEILRVGNVSQRAEPNLTEKLSTPLEEAQVEAAEKDPDLPSPDARP